MLYDYYCGACNLTTEVIKPASLYDSEETCEQCGMKMIKEFVPTRNLTVKAFTPGYNPAFGKYIGSPNEQKDAIKKMKYEEGREMVEIGNEKVRHKKPKFEVDKKSVYQELKKMKVIK